MNLIYRIFQAMQFSDFVYVVCTFILGLCTLSLGVCALVVPYLTEIVKRRCYPPDIKIKFQLEPPFCHKIQRGLFSRTEPQIDKSAYYFRFLVINEGKRRANNCEICLENLWEYDASQTPKLRQDFLPVNIGWHGYKFEEPFVNINPKRKMYGNIGHISSKDYQELKEKEYFIDVRKDSDNGLRFMFDLLQIPFSQPNCLIAGRYIIQVGFYSENAKPQKVYFDMSWSGTWQDKPDEMFKEIVIKRTSKPE